MEEIIKILLKINPLVSIIIASATVVVGDYFAKSWSLSQNNIKYFLLSILFYGFSGVFFTPTLIKNGLVYSSILWSVLSILGFMFIGIIVFKEQLSSLQIIGAIFAIISIIILSISN